MTSPLNQIIKRLDEIDAAIFLKPGTVESLTAALRLACEALESQSQYASMTYYPQHERNHALLVEVPHYSNEALIKIAKKLKGDL